MERGWVQIASRRILKLIPFLFVMASLLLGVNCALLRVVLSGFPVEYISQFSLKCCKVYLTNRCIRHLRFFQMSQRPTFIEEWSSFRYFLELCQEWCVAALTPPMSTFLYPCQAHDFPHDTHVKKVLSYGTTSNIMLKLLTASVCDMITLCKQFFRFDDFKNS